MIYIYILGSSFCQMCLLKLRFSACSCKVLFNFPFGNLCHVTLSIIKKKKCKSGMEKCEEISKIANVETGF